MDDAAGSEIDQLESKVEEAGMPKAALEKTKSETEQAQNDVADVSGGLSRAQLHRLDGRCTLDEAQSRVKHD